MAKGSGIPAGGVGRGGPAKGASTAKPRAPTILTTEQARIVRAVRDTADAKARRAAREAAQAELEARAVEIALTQPAHHGVRNLREAHVMVGGATRTELTGADAGPIDIRSIPTSALLAALAAADGAAGSGGDPGGVAPEGGTD